MNQELALEIMLAGHSAFLTGAAGTGKTHTLNEFIRLSKQTGKKVAVTATTGIAATHLGGNTIHGWSGIGVLGSLPRRFFDGLAKSRIEKIEKADILVIDEISMLHDYRLDLVDEVCRMVRKNDVPFGGIQVVLSGDFFQLPPVTRREDPRHAKLDLASSENNQKILKQVQDDNYIKTEFAYHAKSWQDLSPTILYLDSQHRQTDNDFLDILNKIRRKEITRIDAEKIAARYNAELNDGQEITELHTTNRDVDFINDRKMNELPGDFVEFEMTHTGAENYVERMKKSCLAPELLRLKKGALVMALKNDPEQGFVNGSIGTIKKFAEPFNQPVVEFRNGRNITVSKVSWELRDGDRKLASLTQIPLRPAYAITVHKSQGMTLDAAKINLKNVFEPGMGYVALSRVKSLDSLSILGLHSRAFQVHSEVLEKDAEFQQKSTAAREEFKHLLKNKKKREKESAKLAAEETRKAETKKKFPNAGKRWSENDDQVIAEIDQKKFAKKTEFAEDTIIDLSGKLSRSPTSIAARIAKVHGEEIFGDAKLREKYFPKFRNFQNKLTKK